MMNKCDPPCYDKQTHTDCPDRYVGCSAKCEKWSKYESLRDASYIERVAESEAIRRKYDAMGRDKHLKKIISNRSNRRGRNT